MTRVMYWNVEVKRANVEVTSHAVLKHKTVYNSRKKNTSQFKFHVSYLHGCIISRQFLGRKVNCQG